MNQNGIVLAIFLVTYAGIALGRVPGLALDRTGIALLGAVAMLLAGAIGIQQSVAAVDVPTILLLYALMIFSAQFRLGGFYTWTVLRLVPQLVQPRRFLAGLMLTAAALSALLANDVVCLAFTPVVITACRVAGVAPLPHLLGLAIASNLGSAATLIGNPQNMLLGQVGHLDFAAFSTWNLPPAAISLLVAYLILCRLHRGDLALSAAAPRLDHQPGWPDFNAWQSAKGLILLAILIGLFLTDLPRELAAIALAGLLLASRKMHTRDVLGLVDWHLITLFIALFVLLAAFAASGWPDRAVAWLADSGIHINMGGGLLLAAALLSNLVSNVPACMLLLPMLPPADMPQWFMLAAASTYAGNLFLIGSIANLIVAEQARAQGIVLGFSAHARAGIPVTLSSLAILWLWMLQSA